MKSMTELISPKAQEAFAGFMSTRVEYGVFTGRDLKAATKGNSEFFAQFADLRDVEIRRFSDKDVRMEDIKIPGAREDK